MVTAYLFVGDAELFGDYSCLIGVEHG